MRHSREQKLMIDFANNRAWCFPCQSWISHENLFIDGTHTIIEATSTHTIWGEEIPTPTVADYNQRNIERRERVKRNALESIEQSNKLDYYSNPENRKVEWPPVGSLSDDIPPMIPDIQLHSALERDIHSDIDRYGE